MTGNEKVEFAYPRIIHARILMTLQNLLNIIKILKLRDPYLPGLYILPRSEADGTHLFQMTNNGFLT